MKDFDKITLGKIKESFTKGLADSKVARAKLKALKSGKLTHKDSGEYADAVGDALSSAYKTHIRADGEQNVQGLSAETADSLLRPTLTDAHGLVADFSAEVQAGINKKAGIRLKAARAKLDKEKLQGLIDKVSSYDNFEDAQWVLDEPVKGFVKAAVDDTVKVNAKLHHDAGLSPRIKRTGGGECCKWCAALVGTFRYPDEVPPDVWRRHRRCTCTVDFISSKERTNVHTKKEAGSVEHRVAQAKLIERQYEAEAKAREKKRIAEEKEREVRHEGRKNAEKNVRIEKAGKIKIVRKPDVSGDSFNRSYHGNASLTVTSKEITKVTTIAGKGTDTTIKDVKRLINEHGSSESEWEKVSGIANVLENGRAAKAELHWYEANGQIYEVKIKKKF